MAHGGQHQIAAGAGLLDDDIARRVDEIDVIAEAAGHPVVARAAVEPVVTGPALEAVRASAKGAAKQAAAELAALRASSKATAASLLIERRVMTSTLEVVEATAAAARCSHEQRACDAEAAAAAVAAIAAAALTRACADRDAAVTALQQLRGDAHSLAQLTLAEKKHLLTKLYDSSCAVRRAVLDAEVDARVAEAAACPSCLLATRTTSLNCGHCICAACAAQLESCPICSERVLTRNRIFI
jgi:hypothetical protein